MRRRRLWLGAGFVVGGYALLCVLARLAAPSLLYPAPRLVRPPEGFAERHGTQSVDIAHPDGSKTIALYVAPPDETTGRVVVVFHGNGQHAYDELGLADWLGTHGLGALVVEYRGYGLVNGGPTTEKKIYEDAEASLAWLAKRGIPNDRIVLWGYSLGSGVAVEMATRGHGGRIVLLAPYTSIIDVAKRFAPFLPVRLLLADHFDTLAKAPSVRVPTLVVHGARDDLIPVAMGERVARAIRDAELVVVTNGTHTDLLADVAGHVPDRDALLATLATFLQR